MFAKIISSATKIHADRRLAVVGLVGFVLLSAAFLVVSYFAYKFAIQTPSDAESARFAALVFAPAIVGLFFAAVLVLGLTGLAIAREGFAAPLRDLRTCLEEALRDPASANKLALPNSQAGELGEVIGAANDLFGLISSASGQVPSVTPSMDATPPADVTPPVDVTPSETVTAPEVPDPLDSPTADPAPSIVPHLPDAVIAYDSDRKIADANVAGLALCGFATIEELQETAEPPRFEMSPGAPPLALPDCLAEGTFSRDVILIGKDEQRTPILLNAARLPDSEDYPVRYYASMIDLSERHTAQARLENQNRALSKANRAKSEFLANMSHELRTPLNAIIGFSEIMKNQAFGPLGSAQYLDYMEDIHNSGNHLVSIINDILDLSKIEAGRMELHEATIPVRTIVESCVRLMHERAENAGIKLVASLPDDLPDLQADERLVKQMLINLLSNGVKFTAAGGTVSVSAQEKSGALLLAVADNGVGMSREEALIALEPFRQVDGKETQQLEGTGLGLPLVKSYIELHEGGFRLNSAPGKGTAITLTFPPKRVITPITERSVA
jgi:signal transduction histidine kinase